MHNSFFIFISLHQCDCKKQLLKKPKHFDWFFADVGNTRNDSNLFLMTLNTRKEKKNLIQFNTKSVLMNSQNFSCPSFIILPRVHEELIPFTQNEIEIGATVWTDYQDKALCK